MNLLSDCSPQATFFGAFRRLLCRGVFVFGDSLRIFGGFRLLLCPKTARFCTNPKAGNILKYFANAAARTLPGITLRLALCLVDVHC